MGESVPPRSRSTGRRPRWTLVLVAVAVGGVTLAATWRDPATTTAVLGYPERIGFVRDAPPMPARPGPVAVVVGDNNFGNLIQHPVAANGDAWTLTPTSWLSLSPDGTRLITYDGPSGNPPVVTDLVGGSARSLAWPASEQGPEPASAQWAAEGTLLITLVDAAADRRGYVVRSFDPQTGASVAVGRGIGAGFDSAGRPVTAATSTVGGEVVVTVRRHSGGPTVQLQPRTPWRFDSLAPHAARVDRSGTSIVVVQALQRPTGARSTFDAGPTAVRVFALDSGEELWSAQLSAWARDCPLVWQGQRPVIPVKQRQSPVQALALGPGSSESLVAVHPQLQSTCLLWAEDAVQGPATPARFGRSTAWWTWYAAPLLVAGTAVLGLALVTATLVWWAMRRRRQRGRRPPQAESRHAAQGAVTGGSGRS